MDFKVRHLENVTILELAGSLDISPQNIEASVRCYRQAAECRIGLRHVDEVLELVFAIWGLIAIRMEVSVLHHIQYRLAGGIEGVRRALVKRLVSQQQRRDRLNDIHPHGG